MAKSQKAPKWGAGSLKAMARLGLNEVRNAVYPESNVAQKHPELGIYGTRTPGEVQDERAGKQAKEEKADSALGQRERQSEDRDEPDRDRGMEME